ncbi:hypothetical protein QWZ16_02330 [Vibrio ostreicida]|uniref:Uncharacterized protein n=1 Tax=Vibrio ostreicida TaxID=526588 RepID=A0ABT8BNE6_9VIBR|nr:hypothetical protein [Vibrio ostreicida]MDN3608610.1 hypothetical protein [Vibrio ostreicida]
MKGLSAATVLASTPFTSPFLPKPARQSRFIDLLSLPKRLPMTLFCL